MHSDEERIALLHDRARILLHRKHKKEMMIWGGLSAAFAAAMAVLFAVLIQSPHSIAEGSYAASSLLSENAGGYVLTAVIAFIAAVAITVICIRLQRKKKETIDREKKEEEIDI